MGDVLTGSVWSLAQSIGERLKEDDSSRQVRTETFHASHTMITRSTGLDGLELHRFPPSGSSSVYILQASRV